MSNALVTDLYELNMAASYLRHEMTGTATFSLFCRRLPRDRGFLVAAGLEDCLSFLEEFAFDEADIEYLASIGFAEDTCVAFVPSVSRVRCGRCRRGASCSRTSRSSRLRRPSPRHSLSRPTCSTSAPFRQRSPPKQRAVESLPRAVSTSSTSASVEPMASRPVSPWRGSLRCAVRSDEQCGGGSALRAPAVGHDGTLVRGSL